MKKALANPVYRRLLLAQILSVLGSGLTTIALGILAFDIAGPEAGAVLGVALGLKMVAYVGVAPLAAALAARLPRRPFLICLDLTRAALVLALPFVSEIWHIYALVFGFQAFSAAFTPSFQAAIPDILPDEDAYAQALSLSRLSYDLEALLSPLLAALALSVLSFHYLFGATALGFLASAALVFSVRLPDPDAAGQGPFRRRAARGLWIYFATPRLRGLLALYLSVAAATAMVIVNTVVRVKGELGLGDQMVALHFAASGIGSMLVALSLPRLLRDRPTRPAMLGGAALLSVTMALAASGPGLVMGLAVWFALGAGASLIQTPSGLLITRSCQPQDRAALFAAQFALSHAAWLAAYPLAGRLGAALGLSTTFAIMAVASALATALAVRLWPAHDPREIAHVHEAQTHTHAPGDPLHHDEETAASAHPVAHRHAPLRHSHVFVIDDHHPRWPSG